MRQRQRQESSLSTCSTARLACEPGRIARRALIVVRCRLRKTVDCLRELGKTVFLTTHYMDETKSLAGRIAIIAAGRIVAEGTPATLGGRGQMPARVRFTLPKGVGVDTLPDTLKALLRSAPDGHVVLESPRPLRELKVLADWALARDLDLPDLDVRRPSLEDVYLELTETAAQKGRE